ncbi:MAG: metallophosphoesterase family protein [Candidatus Hodarchaeota archaeon]
MTSIAVISDIHSNLSALRAVLADIHEKRIQRILCLGDLVGYFTQPVPVIHLALARCEVVIKGNHDSIAALGDVPDHYSIDSHQPLELTNQLLTVRERKILHDLPIIHTKRYGKKKVMLIHGGPEYPLDQYIYPSDTNDINSTFEFMEVVKVDILFLGHTHVPFKAELNGLTICNPGSVGQPRDGDSRASYLVFDDETNAIEFQRIQYDPTLTINGVKKHHLPNELVERLLVGK